MPVDRVALIDSQSRFYQANFRKLINFSLGLIVISYFFLGFIIYQHFTRPTPNYFVATSDGRLLEIKSLAEIQEAGAAGANVNGANVTPAS